MSTSKASSPEYEFWTVRYVLPVGDKIACYTGSTTSERISKECKLIKGWTIKDHKGYDDWKALQGRKTLEYLAPSAVQMGLSLDEWCSWWINDKTCKLDKEGQDPKSNVQVGLYCALRHHQKKSALMALKDGIEMSQNNRSIFNEHTKELDENLEKFEAVRNAGRYGVCVEHIHKFGCDKLSAEKTITKDELTMYVEELLEGYVKKENKDEDEEPNYLFD